MSRAKRASNARGSKNWGIMSGVTIATIPSGTTIYKNNIQTTSGYIPTYINGVANLKIATGYLNVNSAATNQTFAGITTIKHVQATPVFLNSAVTGIEVSVSYNVNPNYSSGATVCHIKTYSYKGAAYGSAVSIAYTVIGV